MDHQFDALTVVTKDVLKQIVISDVRIYMAVLWPQRLFQALSLPHGRCLFTKKNPPHIIIDANYVNEHLGELSLDEDLSQYIL